MKKHIEPTKVKCPRCGHTWNYKGNAYLYITCAKCRFSIKKQLEKEDKQ